MTTHTRRYDIDAIRVIAIGLLLIYHTAIGFQGWGTMIGFITNEKSLPELWSFMAIINIWRIPLLFFVSGMGVYFALQNRSWKQLFFDRGKRILLPFVFGSLAIVPIHIFIFQSYYDLELKYLPNPGHLWFLANIFIYVVLLFPIFYFLKKNADGKIVRFIKKALSSPLGLVLVIFAFFLEDLWTKPTIFELYAMTWHGFLLGLLAFFFGFCFVLAGTDFWEMILKWRYWLLATAILLFVHRFMAPQMKVHHIFLVMESNIWIFSVFAFGYKYLNQKNNLLNTLSPAVYPIYIVHMIVLYIISYWIFPLEINAWFKFLITMTGTFSGSFMLYLLIKRIKIVRPLFGLNSHISHDFRVNSHRK